MILPEKYPFIPVNPTFANATLMPYLPIVFSIGEKSLRTSALLDTGSMTSVLPYSVGLQLGAIWDQQTFRVPLVGGLKGVDARYLELIATVGSFVPVRLAFALAQTDLMPVILGQTNFFMQFTVCFDRSKSIFEIRPA